MITIAITGGIGAGKTTVTEHLISKGYTTTHIAAALNLSPETIRWYRKNLLSKLDVSNTAELVSVSKELGLV